MRTIVFLLIGICCVLVLMGRKSRPVIVVPAFYYWKVADWDFPRESPSSQILDTFRVRKLYIKMFEVGPDPVFRAAPYAKTQLSNLYYAPSTLPEKRELVPVVYIRNEVFLQPEPVDPDTLAANMLYLINRQLRGMYGPEWPVREIQIDCDWTARTRDPYFEVLRRLRKISGKRLSCTLRLYPFKYREKLGVPPVDRAMLMCYNLLNPVTNPGRNTILDNAELEAYLGRKRRYPLPLDVALPVYERAALYKEGRFAGLIETPAAVIPSLTNDFGPFWFEVQRDTVVEALYLRPGDRIKYERMSGRQLLEAANLLRDRLKLSDTTTIACFDLHDNLLNQYGHDTLAHLFDLFAR